MVLLEIIVVVVVVVVVDVGSTEVHGGPVNVGQGPPQWLKHLLPG